MLTLPSFQTRYSLHQLGLAHVLATLTLTDEAPSHVTLIDIVPLAMDLGIELSPESGAVVGELQGLGCLLN